MPYQITWLSQGGFLFEYENLRIVADPYMSDVLSARGFGRMSPPPLSYEEMKPDWVLFTHDHIDHFDETSVSGICSIYPKCKFAGPQSTMEHFSKLGFPNEFELLKKGAPFKFSESACVIPTPAFHSDQHAVGLLFDFGGKLAWLSGDTLFDQSLAKSVEELAGGRRISAAMICINGRLGNMNAQEAAKVISSLRPELAIPMHFGLFAGNTADPEPFVKALEKENIKTLVAEAGKPYKIS